MALLPLLLVVVLAAAVTVGAVLTRRVPPSAEATVAAARQHASWTALTAVVVAAAAALAAGATSPFTGDGPASLGIAALLVPVTFGVVHTAVLALGELTWPRPQGPLRRARLVRRGLLDAAPRWLVRLAGGTVVGAAVTLVLGAVLAEDDGRSVSLRSADGMLTGTASPFPGWTYGGPAALGLLALTALTIGALRVVATRAAVVTTDERAESALRRASAHRVLRGAVGSALVTTSGLVLVAGMSTRSVAGNVGPQALAVLGLVLFGCGLAGLLAGLVVLCVRAPGVPADQQVPA
ncbi:hypothetical protein [Modestobacter altitudinis]|uniref:hypothetical protein n=1 Tax=Modestobacter altitudinis TaxID=2213158 RepID=UPI00110C8F61|nr:hypothetical protein [Modestobacter altitudinis]